MAESKCLEVLILGDDTQKLPLTFHCCLPMKHDHSHQERGHQDIKNESGETIGISYYSMTWSTNFIGA